MISTNQPNRYLDLLLKAEPQISSHLETVALEHRFLISQAHEMPTHLYFPHDSVASVIVVMRDGQTSEIATIGSEGMTGVSVLLGGPAFLGETIIQVSGTAERIPAQTMRTIVDENPTVRNLQNRYLTALLSQVAQSSACNRLHQVEERAARWLLMTSDRTGTGSLRLTHEFLSTMLGVRRSTTTLTVGALQKAELINVGRGRITILNRLGLEDVACECYGVIRNEYDRFFAGELN